MVVTAATSELACSVSYLAPDTRAVLRELVQIVEECRTRLGLAGVTIEGPARAPNLELPVVLATLARVLACAPADGTQALGSPPAPARYLIVDASVTCAHADAQVAKIGPSTPLDEIRRVLR